MVENSKVKRKSGRRNPAGLLSFVSLSGKER
jgi:preprotein translocase subunit Sec61beta